MELQASHTNENKQLPTEQSRTFALALEYGFCATASEHHRPFQGAGFELGLQETTLAACLAVGAEAIQMVLQRDFVPEPHVALLALVKLLLLCHCWRRAAQLLAAAAAASCGTGKTTKQLLKTTAFLSPFHFLELQISSCGCLGWSQPLSLISQGKKETDVEIAFFTAICE